MQGKQQTELQSDLVVWNTWIGNAKTMCGFGEEEYAHMTYIEPGRVSEYQHLAVDDVYTVSQTIRATKLSTNEIHEQIPPASFFVERQSTPAIIKSSEHEVIAIHHWSGPCCEVSRYGATVLSFYTADEPQRNALFVSKKAAVDCSMSIRGGIPLVFPIFGPASGFPNHGFARTSTE